MVKDNISVGERSIKRKIEHQETNEFYTEANNSPVSQNNVYKIAKVDKDLELKLKNTKNEIFDCKRSVVQHRNCVKKLNMIIKLWCLIHIQIKNI